MPDPVVYHVQTEGDGGANDACHDWKGHLSPNDREIMVAPQVFAIYWDAYFQQNPGSVSLMNQFFQDILTSAFMDGLRQYGVQTGSLRGSTVIPTPAPAAWWLRSYDSESLGWRPAGNTWNMGNVCDGRPFWIGKFSQPDRDEVLFYYPGDDNWILGSYDGSGLNWRRVSNTRSMGHGINDGRPFWIGKFSQPDRDEVLFYYPGDDNWIRGSYDGSQLSWTVVDNTRGFGHGINDGRPFWIGKFSQAGRDEMLFYYLGDMQPIDDEDIETQLKNWIDEEILPRPGDNETNLLYIIFTRQGVEIKYHDLSSRSDFCGYHDWGHYNKILGDSNFFGPSSRGRAHGTSFLNGLHH